MLVQNVNNALCSGLHLGSAAVVMRPSCASDVYSVSSIKMTQGLTMPICKEMVTVGIRAISIQWWKCVLTAGYSNSDSVSRQT